MKIRVVESVMKANDAVAEENRRILARAGVLTINVMSAPGSGKTTLLRQTIPALQDLKSAVLVGDLQTTRDAERLNEFASEIVQINTGKGCHLSATQVADGLKALNLDDISFLWIENVGNMVCPAEFDLGEDKRAVLLSVPEGDDKVAKYPVLFRPADVILLTKVDLLGIIDFDMEKVRDDLSRINTRAPLIKLSSKTGEGMEEWIEWLRSEHGRHTAGK